MSYRLKITKGKAAGKEFSFAKGRVTAGRNHDNDLVLYDLNVSRLQFEIVLREKTYRLRDLGSQNGTRLNGRLIRDEAINENDRIQVGSVEFEFLASDTQPAYTMPEATERREVDAPASLTQRMMLEQIQTYAVKLSELKDHGLDEAIKQQAPVKTPVKRRRSASNRLVLYGAISLGTAVLLFGLFWIYYRSRPQADFSDHVFSLTRAADSHSYGGGERVDIKTKNQLKLAFASQVGRTIFTYTAGGITRPGEVVILLNGVQIQALAITGEHWGLPSALKLDRKLLHAGGDNLLVFQYRPGEDSGHWGVRDLGLTEDPLPMPSLSRAQELMSQAADMITHKRVAAGNLQAAEAKYRQAVLLLEGYEPPPAEYTDAEKRYQNVRQELDGIVAEGVFQAERAERYGKSAEAERILKDLLLYVPSESDHRHDEIIQHLNALKK